MNKETIAAADFERKSYAKPRINVVKINDADIISTSDPTIPAGDPDGDDKPDPGPGGYIWAD